MVYHQLAEVVEVLAQPMEAEMHRIQKLHRSLVHHHTLALSCVATAEDRRHRHRHRQRDSAATEEGWYLVDQNCNPHRSCSVHHCHEPRELDRHLTVGSSTEPDRRWDRAATAAHCRRHRSRDLRRRLASQFALTGRRQCLLLTHSLISRSRPRDH